MTKYLFVYWTPNRPSTPPSPEQMQEMLQAWSNWKAQFSNEVLDMGDGLLPGGKILRDNDVLDGPLPEAKEIVGGFSVIQARDYEAALEVARCCPIHHMPEASIEIRQLAGY